MVGFRKPKKTSVDKAESEKTAGKTKATGEKTTDGNKAESEKPAAKRKPFEEKPFKFDTGSNSSTEGVHWEATDDPNPDSLEAAIHANIELDFNPLTANVSSEEMLRKALSRPSVNDIPTREELKRRYNRICRVYPLKNNDLYPFRKDPNSKIPHPLSRTGRIFLHKAYECGLVDFFEVKGKKGEKGEKVYKPIRIKIKKKV
jgi:hypothetical protein